MKRLIQTISSLMLIALCCVAVFSEAGADRQWTIKGFPGNYWSSYKRMTDKIQISELSRVPDFLQNSYENGPFYFSKILTYDENIEKSYIVEIEKDPYMNNVSLRYFYRGDSLFSLISQDLDAALKGLPVIKKGLLRGRFECSMYNASKYADKVKNNPYLTVVRDNGRIIWCVNAESVGDVVMLPDGRYLVVTERSAYYVTVTDKRIIGEVYFGNRRVAASDQYVDRERLPVSIVILTDNVIRQEYEDGSVEHWKIRLSEEDVDKNTEKWRTIYEQEGKSVPKEVGDKCLLWCNGKGKGSLTRNNQKMWCYQEGGPEPTAESYSKMGLAKTVSDRGTFEANTVARKDQPQQAEARAATGRLAGLFARVKSWFAGLFS